MQWTAFPRMFLSSSRTQLLDVYTVVNMVALCMLAKEDRAYSAKKKLSGLRAFYCNWNYPVPLVPWCLRLSLWACTSTSLPDADMWCEAACGETGHRVRAVSLQRWLACPAPDTALPQHSVVPPQAFIGRAKPNMCSWRDDVGIISLHSLKVAATGHCPPKWSRTGNMPTVSNSLKNHVFLSISKHEKGIKKENLS